MGREIGDDLQVLYCGKKLTTTFDKLFGCWVFGDVKYYCCVA